MEDEEISVFSRQTSQQDNDKSTMPLVFQHQTTEDYDSDEDNYPPHLDLSAMDRSQPKRDTKLEVAALEAMLKLELEKGSTKIDAQLRKVFVGGLPHNLAIDIFRDYFKKFGLIDDIVILQDKRTHKPRGFGFVTYEDIKSVNIVLRMRQHHFIQDKWVDVKSAVPIEQMKQVLSQQQNKAEKAQEILESKVQDDVEVGRLYSKQEVEVQIEEDDVLTHFQKLE